MNFFRSARKALASAIFREGAIGTIDEDELLFRPISETPDRDDPLDSLRRDKNRRLARVQYFRNAVGGALIDNLVSRVIGADAEWTAEDKDVQAVVDRFVTDPDNDLPQYLELYAAELLAFGELVLPIFLTPENADVRLGYLIPEQVETILWKRGDAKKPLAALQPRSSVDGKKRLWIIPHPDPTFENRYPPHPALTPDEEEFSVTGEDGLPVILPNDGKQVLPEIAEMMEREGDGLQIAGYAFYHRTNCLVSGRGRSIYERVNDWLKALDDFFFGVLRNAILQGAFVWWWKITNADDVELDKWRAKYSRPPKPGSQIFTNEKVELKALSPALPAGAQVREIFTGTLKLIGVAVGSPGHELGAEDDTNRATAGESRSVSINRAKRFQRTLRAMVCAWLGYTVDQKVYAKQLPEGVNRAVECALPELDVRDEAEAAATFKATVEASVTAVDRELLLLNDAREAVYRALGLQAPSEAEFRKALDQERKARDESFMDGAADRLKNLIDQIGRGDRAGDPEPAPEPAATG